jgi:hypothetical protein
MNLSRYRFAVGVPLHALLTQRLAVALVCSCLDHEDRFASRL